MSPDGRQFVTLAPGKEKIKAGVKDVNHRIECESTVFSFLTVTLLLYFVAAEGAGSFVKLDPFHTCLFWA